VVQRCWLIFSVNVCSDGGAVHSQNAVKSRRKKLDSSDEDSDSDSGYVSDSLRMTVINWV